VCCCHAHGLAASRLDTLYLDYNGLTLRFLADDQASSDSSLQYLTLSGLSLANNQISTLGIEGLAAALRTNSSLSWLSLVGNSFDARVAIALFGALLERHHYTLRTLVLDDCHGTDCSCQLCARGGFSREIAKANASTRLAHHHLLRILQLQRQTQLPCRSGAHLDYPAVLNLGLWTRLLYRLGTRKTALAYRFLRANVAPWASAPKAGDVPPLRPRFKRPRAGMQEHPNRASSSRIELEEEDTETLDAT
jgi:hypothetical protein